MRPIQIKTILRKHWFFAALAVLLIGNLLLCGYLYTNAEDEGKNSIPTKNTYFTDELSLQSGMSLFNEHCANCHNFESNEIGPNLTGVTTIVDKQWLIAFIKNATALIESGDERAVKNYQKYKLYMPSFPMLKEKDIENILGFIHKFSQGEKRNKKNRKGGLINPIPTKIAPPKLSLLVEEAFTVPASSDNMPLTRINKMESIITEEGERSFIVDLRGKLFEIANDTVDVYLNLSTELPNFIDRPGFGSGFGSFVFHPDFDTNGLLYTTHTEPPKTTIADFAFNDSIKVSLQWVLTEWKTDHPKSHKFSGTPREILRADMYNSFHGFQELTFNPLPKPGDPDYGLLYLAVGEGGAALGGYSLLCNSNRTIWGAVLRIDPRGRNSANGKYGIPKDNPFASDPYAAAEIWCRGFRNPHRISWDKTGSEKMFISNIGQHSVEEINLGKAGADYGWPHREGTFLFDAKANPEFVYPLPKDDSGYTYPVVQYDHDEGNAVSGGFVYAGNQIPQLSGKYIFGDIPRGTLFYSELSEMVDGQQAKIHRLGLEINGKPTSLQDITANERVDLRLGIGTSNALFLFTKTNGKVYKVVGCK